MTALRCPASLREWLRRRGQTEKSAASVNGFEEGGNSQAKREATFKSVSIKHAHHYSCLEATLQCSLQRNNMGQAAFCAPEQQFNWTSE
jgi:hypothetical protein